MPVGYQLDTALPYPGILQEPAVVCYMWQGGPQSHGALLWPPHLQPGLLSGQLQ
jgi:hypothetical protein